MNRATVKHGWCEVCRSVCNIDPCPRCETPVTWYKRKPLHDHPGSNAPSASPARDNPKEPK